MSIHLKLSLRITCVIFLFIPLLSHASSSSTSELLLSKPKYDVGLTHHIFYDDSRVIDLLRVIFNEPIYDAGVRTVITHIFYPTVKNSSTAPKVKGLDFFFGQQEAAEFVLRDIIRERELNGRAFTNTEAQREQAIAEILNSELNSRANVPIANKFFGKFPVVVLSPGFINHPFRYADLAEFLAARGYVVVMPYLAGHHQFVPLGIDPNYEVNNPGIPLELGGHFGVIRPTIGLDPTVQPEKFLIFLNFLILGGEYALPLESLWVREAVEDIKLVVNNLHEISAKLNNEVSTKRVALFGNSYMGGVIQIAEIELPQVDAIVSVAPVFSIEPFADDITAPIVADTPSLQLYSSEDEVVYGLQFTETWLLPSIPTIEQPNPVSNALFDLAEGPSRLIQMNNWDHESWHRHPTDLTSIINKLEYLPKVYVPGEGYQLIDIDSAHAIRDYYVLLWLDLYMKYRILLADDQTLDELFSAELIADELSETFRDKLLSGELVEIKDSKNSTRSDFINLLFDE